MQRLTPDLTPCFSSELAVTAEVAFDWHMREGAFERLVPPWERIRVLARDQPLADGSRVLLEMRLGPMRLRWTAVHRDIVAGQRFTDEQHAGPFRRWRHVHRFVNLGDGRSRLEDDISFALPLAPASTLVAGRLVRNRLARTFRYRHAVTRGDLAAHAVHAAAPRLSVGVTDASGSIGRHLLPFLTTGGHRAIAMGPESPAEPLDAVVHLATASPTSRRRSPEQERAILQSGIAATARLATSLAGLPTPPRVLVCASDVGIYGDRPGEVLDEASAPGEGALAELCREREAACEPARTAGIRVVWLRFGVVLDPRGGALRAMLPLFRVGLGGWIGDGRATVSWVSLDDVLGAIGHALCDPALEGAVNVCAPESVSCRTLAATLARVLRRPAAAGIPLPLARAVFGGRVSAAVARTHAVPTRLLSSGYRFRFERLEPALRHVLGHDGGSKAFAA